MEWPSTKDCYAAMLEFVDYYMEGDQKIHWKKLIEEGLEASHFPPGKSFLHEIDQIIKVSSKPSMPKRSELYELIFTVCL